MKHDSRAVSYADLDTLLHTYGKIVVCTIVMAQGSVPRRLGARMAVLPGGETRGTIGGGLFEGEVIADALTALAARQSVVKRYDFRPVGASPEAFGAICGGQVEIFLEVAALGDHLLIVGGGHCGRALARSAALLDTLRVTLVDDRPDHAERDGLPDSVAVELSAPDFSDLPARVGSETYVVLVSQGFKTDQVALHQVIFSPAPYIGMMGSRKKARTVLQALADENVPADRLARVHAPIGLPIEAETPAEIAVSILAQIIAVQRGAKAEQET